MFFVSLLILSNKVITMLFVTTEKDKINYEMAAKTMFFTVSGFDKLSENSEVGIDNFYKLNPNKIYIAQSEWDDDIEDFKDVFIPLTSKYPRGQEFSSLIEDMYLNIENGHMDENELENNYGCFLGFYQNNVGEFVPIEPVDDIFGRTLSDNSKIKTLDFMYNGIWNNMRPESALKYLDVETYINNDDMLNTIATDTINQLFNFPVENDMNSLKLYQLAINGHPVWGNIYNPEDSIYVSSVANQIKSDLEDMSRLSQTYLKNTSIDLQLITNTTEMLSKLGVNEDDLLKNNHYDNEYLSKKLQNMVQSGEIKLETQSVPMMDGVSLSTLAQTSQQAARFYENLIFIKEHQNELDLNQKNTNTIQNKPKMS